MNRTVSAFLLLLISMIICNDLAAQRQPASHLAKKGKAVQLMVQGKPFLVLGGELGNSTASDLAYLQPAWEKLVAMNLNTILVPVYWELMEPEEGKFDFRLVDSIIRIAEKNNLKIVPLWFGAWKNSMSCYAPSWVKSNPGRFPRAQDKSGKRLEILSAIEKNNLDADAKAFSALMAHIRDFDTAGTVIMVQVENEIGMLTEARERTANADRLFGQDVPKELMDYLVKNKDSLVPEFRDHWATAGFKTKGNWETIFGKSLATDELFQAWHYAKFANAVARAGKQQYALPMFVNAALNHRNVLPGQYPSAGPLPQVMDIWQAAAPDIDILSPDFYNPRFKYYNDLYTRRNNPLFIPEIRFENSNAAKAFYAIGHYHAIGFSPFSIESTKKPFEESIGKSYSILKQLTPEIMKYQGTNRLEGVLLDTQVKKQEIIAGSYSLSVAHDYTLGWSPGAAEKDWPQSGAIIISTGEDEFIIAGTGVVITFNVYNSEKEIAGILQADEGIYQDGKWIPGRRLNGDQTHQGRHIRIPWGEWVIQKVKLYKY